MVHFVANGNLVQLECASSERIKNRSRYSTYETVSGNIRALVLPRTRRTWDIGVDTTTPSEVAKIQDFINGAGGNGPFGFYPAEAPQQNMLTPETVNLHPDSLPLGNTVLAGSVQLAEGGFAPSSYLNNDVSQLLWFGRQSAPVRAGDWVTGSAWVQGAGCKVAIYFYKPDGSAAGSALSTTTGVADKATRLSVSAVVPSGAVTARVFGYKSQYGTRPALTWTKTMQPFAPGRGCEKAIIVDDSEDIVSANIFGSYSDYAFTVQEVG